MKEQVDAILDVYEQENNGEVERKAKEQEGTADTPSEVQADAGNNAEDPEEPEATKAEPQEQADAPKPAAEEPLGN